MVLDLAMKFNTKPAKSVRSPGREMLLSRLAKILFSQQTFGNENY